MDFKHPKEGRARAVQSSPNVVGFHPYGDQVLAVEQLLHLELGDHFHPCRIFSHINSAFLAAAGDVSMRIGHERVNPSDGHLRVASIPILLPYAARSLASSRSSTGPLVN